MKNKNKSDRDIPELIDLIQKEKEEALRIFREKDFKSRLNERIEAEPQKPTRDVFWFRKPVIATGLVMLLVVLGWIATQIFTPTLYERDVRAIKKTLAKAFDVQELLIAQSVPHIESQLGLENLYEFEWSLKRVVYSIQIKNIPDSDIPRILGNVLLKATQVSEAEDKAPSGLSPDRENEFLMKENNFL